MTPPYSPTIDPEAAGFDPSALSTLFERIHREVDAGRMPAAQAAFAINGELAVFETFGAATPLTRFNVFSCTKALIAGVVWQLIDEGRLSVATRVVDVVPSFGAEGATPERMAQVTLEHLLTHTAGFPYAPLGPGRWETREGRLETFARWRADFEPGTHFEYHPTAAHWVVAEMVETIEGRDYRQVVRDRVLEPLGLRSVVLGATDADHEHVAQLELVGAPPTPDEIEAVFGVREVDLGEVTAEILLAFNDPSIRAVGVPGGGGIATAADLALYYQELLHNRSGRWRADTLADGTGTIRCTLPDPMSGVAANRSLGLVIAGDDGLGSFRGIGATASPRAFGHNGAGGQIAWADPATGVSFAFTTSGLELNYIREARRTASIAAKAGLCRPAVSTDPR